MANPAPTINQINAFNATQGTVIDFNIIGGTELVRSNKIYIYDLSDNSLICTHLYPSTESIHELPPNNDADIVYADGKSSADFVNNKQYYAQIQTFTNVAGTQGESGLSVAKLFWCLPTPTLEFDTIPASISITSYNATATYDSNITSQSVTVPNIVQQYQFDLYTVTGTLVQSSGVIVGSGEQEGATTVWDLSYNFSGMTPNTSYYFTLSVTTTEGMTLTTQSSTFMVSIDTPTLGKATVVNNACDGYISVTSNLSSEYGGSASGEIATFETDSVNNVTKLEVALTPTQLGSGTPSPSNVRPIVGHSSVAVEIDNGEDTLEVGQDFNVTLTPTVIDETPYLFKQTGEVRGDMESLELVGGTVAWNQLIPIAGSSKTKTESNVTITDNRDGSYTVQTTQDGASADVNLTLTSATTSNGGHVGILYGCPSGGYVSNSVKYRLWDAWGGIGNDYGNGHVGKWVAGGQFEIRISVASGTVITTPIKFVPQLFDLTQMFGSTIADYIYSLKQATAGAGVAWFKKLFPKPYYAYNAGELMSVNASSHDMVGFNAWDEVTELGYISNSTGENVSSTSQIRGKNYIPVIPNTTYYFKSPTGLFVYFYDANKEYIGVHGSGTRITNNTITLGADVHYIRVSMPSDYGTTYKSDICINLSWDGERDGEYEAYDKHSYPLDSSLTLRGIPKLDENNNLYYDGDTYESDGTVTRKYYYLKIDGDTTLSIGGNVSGGIRYTTFSTLPITSLNTNATSPKLMSNAFISAIGVTAGNAYVTGNGTILVCVFQDQTLDTDTKVRTYLASHPIEFILPRATPITETADPFTDPQEVSIYGTEEFVSSNGVPVGNKTTYKTRDIFGGTIDLASGVLTVDRKGVLFVGDENWQLHTYNSSITSYKLQLSDIKAMNATDDIFDCDKFEYQRFAWAYIDYGLMGGSDRTVYFTRPNSEVSTIELWKSWLAKNPVQLIYELATPLTYQLTPHQIETLIGTNNVWSDAGDVLIEFNIPITDLLVKRQDVDDVSGNWLTLYSQPITQASDMDFTYIDFLNQYGKTYQYALVPLLIQSQSGVVVEVEGGYTVSDNVLSQFDYVFITDVTGSEKLKANVGYGNVNMSQNVGSILPIGAKYPVVVTNSHNAYHSGSISGYIVPDDFYTNGNLSRVAMVAKRDELEQFLVNKKPKIIKDWNGKIWLVMITGDVDCSFDSNYGMGMVTFTASWVEVGDATSQEDLQNTGLINVGGV